MYIIPSKTLGFYLLYITTSPFIYQGFFILFHSFLRTMNESFRSLLFPLYLLRTLLPSFVIIPTQLSYARTRAGTDLELKTKVCPSFMLNFSFFASGVWEAQGFICTAHRGLNRHAKRESLAQTFIARQGQTSNLNKTNTEFFSEALRKTRSTC